MDKLRSLVVLIILACSLSFAQQGGGQGGGGSGGGTPGGSDTQVQFNDANTFGGDADFTYDKTTKSVTLSGNPSAAILGNLTVGSFSGTGNGMVNFNNNNGQTNEGEALDVSTENSVDVAPAEPIYGEMHYTSPALTTGYDLASISTTVLVDGSGTIPGVWGFRSRMTLGAPVITDAGGLDIPKPTITGTSITNLYGLRIGDFSSGATNNYAIKIAGGQNDLGPQTTTAGSFISKGTTFATNNGCGETTNLVGGATAGTIHTSGSTSCTTIVTMGNGATAPHGWACHVEDITTAGDIFHPSVTPTSQTTVTIVSGTIVAGDTLLLGPCIGY